MLIESWPSSITNSSSCIPTGLKCRVFHVVESPSSIDLDSLKHGPSGFTTDHDTLTERPSIPMIELGFSTVEFNVKYEGEGNSFPGSASN